MPFDYNCNLLVQTVEKYPCIWNRGDVDYRSKTVKDRSWAEICRSLEPNFTSFDLTKQNEIENTLRDKWSNIRDTMVRYLRQRCTKPSTKRYHYADACHFLEKMYSRSYDPEALQGLKMSGEEIEFEPNIHNVMCVLGDDGDESATGEYVSRVKTEPPDELELERSIDDNHVDRDRRGSTSEEDFHPPHRKKSKVHDSLDVSRHDSTARFFVGSNPDEDEAFFLSVLPHVRSLPQDEKIDFRMGVLQMIKDAKKRYSAVSTTS